MFLQFTFRNHYGAGNPRVTLEVTKDMYLLTGMMSANLYYSRGVENPRVTHLDDSFTTNDEVVASSMDVKAYIKERWENKLSYI